MVVFEEKKNFTHQWVEEEEKKTTSIYLRRGKGKKQNKTNGLLSVSWASVKKIKLNFDYDKS